MALLRELGSIGKALEDMQEQNQRLTKLIRERDETNSRLFADVRGPLPTSPRTLAPGSFSGVVRWDGMQRAKSSQQVAGLTRERDLLKAKIAPLEKVTKTQAAVLQKAEARDRLQQQQLVRSASSGRAQLVAAYDGRWLPPLSPRRRRSRKSLCNAGR